MRRTRWAAPTVSRGATSSSVRCRGMCRSRASGLCWRWPRCWPASPAADLSLPEGVTFGRSALAWRASPCTHGRITGGPAPAPPAARRAIARCGTAPRDRHGLLRHRLRGGRQRDVGRGAQRQHPLQRRRHHGRGLQQAGVDIGLERHHRQQRLPQPGQQRGAQDADGADVGHRLRGRQPGVAGGRLDQRPHAVGLRRQDQRLRQRPPQRDAGGAARGALRRPDQAQALAQHRRPAEFGQRAVVEQHGQLDLPGAQLWREVAGEFLGQLQLHLGQGLAHRAQQRQGQRAGDAVRQAEHHLAAGVPPPLRAACAASSVCRRMDTACG